MTDNAVKAFEVCVSRLDDFEEILNARHLKLIKIDVEGEEIRCLRGAMKTLVTHRPIVAVEINWEENFVRGNESLEDFYAMLSGCGYRVYDFFGEPVSGIDRDLWNVVLTPDADHFEQVIKPI